MSEKMIFAGKVEKYGNRYSEMYITIKDRRFYHWVGSQIGILVALQNDLVMPFIGVLYVDLPRAEKGKIAMLPKIGEDILVVGEQRDNDWEHRVHAIITLKPEELRKVVNILSMKPLVEASVLTLNTVGDYTYEFLVFYSQWRTLIGTRPALESLLAGNQKRFMEFLIQQLSETTKSLARFTSRGPSTVTPESPDHIESQNRWNSDDRGSG